MPQPPPPQPVPPPARVVPKSASATSMRNVSRRKRAVGAALELVDDRFCVPWPVARDLVDRAATAGPQRARARAGAAVARRTEQHALRVDDHSVGHEPVRGRLTKRVHEDDLIAGRTGGRRVEGAGGAGDPGERNAVEGSRRAGRETAGRLHSARRVRTERKQDGRSSETARNVHRGRLRRGNRERGQKRAGCTR